MLKKTKKKNYSILLGITALIFFIVSAIYITFPLIFHMTDRVTGFGDELVITWIQNWVIHALTTNPLTLFEANVYYPYHTTLAFADTYTLTSILAMPIRFITGEPISTFNYTFISSLIFLGFSIYLLCFYLTRNFLVSLFAGVLIIFSPAVLDYTVHVQVLSVQCVPLAILFFLHFIKTGKSKFLAVSLLIFVLQVFNSIMPGYFILFSYLIIYLFYLRDNKNRTLKLISRTNILLFIIAFTLLTPIAAAYFSVSKEFNYVRDIRDAVHFAFQPEDFLYPGNRTHLQSFLHSAVPTNQFSQNGEFKPGYLGLVFSLLVILTLWYIVKNIRHISIYIKSFLSIALLGFILSLGPVLHLFRQTVHEPFLIPLPYALFYYLIPGFQGIRNSGRWNMLFMLAIVVVIALVLNKLLSKYSIRKQVIIYCILFLGIIFELSPLKLFPIKQTAAFPPVYSWIATTPADSKIIELPIYNWNMDPFTKQEIFREYYGTLHFRRTVNGYTGFSPPPWQVLVKELDHGFPSDKTVDKLKEIGIDYIILHKNEYDELNNANFQIKDILISDGSEIIKQTDNNTSLKLLKRFEDTYVYGIND